MRLQLYRTVVSVVRHFNCCCCFCVSICLSAVENHLSLNFSWAVVWLKLWLHFLYSYGDRCPQSISAKAFAIAWFLIGLVIFSLFLGSLTAVLTVTMVSMDLNGPSSSKDRKVISFPYLSCLLRFTISLTLYPCCDWLILRAYSTVRPVHSTVVEKNEFAFPKAAYDESYCCYLRLLSPRKARFFFLHALQLNGNITIRMALVVCKMLT